MKHKAPALRSKLRYIVRIPLPITIPVHRTIGFEQARDHLYTGMQLDFKQSANGMSIAIVGFYLNDRRIIGTVPQGMLPYIEELLPYADEVSVQVECGTCERLSDSMWITIDELPGLDELGLETSY